MTKLATLGAALIWTAVSLTAQETRPLALVNARILTMTDAGTIERGTILVRDGRIDAVGVDVTVPPGARIVDVAGGTVMPGFVHAWSRAGVAGERRQPTEAPSQARGRGRGMRGGTPSGPPSNAAIAAAKKVADELYARQDVFGDLADEGVTTLVVRPDGLGLPGLAARLGVDPADQSAQTVTDDAFVLLIPAPNPKASKTVKDAFDKAKAVLDERKKPKEEPKPEAPKEGAAQPEQKPAEPKEGEPKPVENKEEKKEEKPAEPKPAEAAKPQEAAKPAPPKDPNIEVLADLLDGKRTAFVRLSSAMDVQHYKAGIGDHQFPTVVVADRRSPQQGMLQLEADWLKAQKAIVLTTPTLDQIPYTRTLVNTPAELAAAGVEVGFLLMDEPRSIRAVPYLLMELVRAGYDANAALRGVTAVPAKALGIDKDVGSIAKGLRADLLVFSADPLDPTSSLQSVYLNGRERAAGADR